jgi:hypothetical protein
VKTPRVAKTVKIELALNERIKRLVQISGEDDATIIRMAIRAGLPMLERSDYNSLIPEENAKAAEEPPVLDVIPKRKKSVGR